MSEVKTYKASDNIIILGARQLTGFGEDDAFKLTPLGGGIQIKVGCYGDVGRSLDPNECYELELTLLGTSEDNDYLSTLYNIDNKTGKGMVPIVIKDLTGTTTFAASQCWVAKRPELGRGKVIKENKWVLQTGKATMFTGGNN